MVIWEADITYEKPSSCLSVLQVDQDQDQENVTIVVVNEEGWQGMSLPRSPNAQVGKWFAKIWEQKKSKVANISKQN